MKRWNRFVGYLLFLWLLYVALPLVQPQAADCTVTNTLTFTSLNYSVSGGFGGMALIPSGSAAGLFVDAIADPGSCTGTGSASGTLNLSDPSLAGNRLKLTYSYIIANYSQVNQSYSGTVVYRIKFNGIQVDSRTEHYSTGDQGEIQNARQFEVDVTQFLGQSNVQVSFEFDVNVTTSIQYGYVELYALRAQICAEESNAKIKSITFEKPVGQFAGSLNGDIDDNPTEPGFGGGQRIFPDADIETRNEAKNEVWITIETTAAGKVYVTSFDVDDSGNLFATGHGDDNLGPDVIPDFPVMQFPKKGGFRKDDNSPIVINQPIEVNAVQSGTKFLAKVKFVVTMQPGDNFKLAATTDPNLLNRLTVNVQTIHDNDQTQPRDIPETSPTAPPDVAMASTLLTVWRKLHVEVDSMSEPPNPEVTGTDQNPERNFIVGDVVEITDDGTKLRLVAAQTTPPLRLDDGSPNLSGSGLATFQGNGRFENGTIMLGTNLIGNASMSTIANNSSPLTSQSFTVVGNGVDKDNIEYIQLTQTLSIPCTIYNANQSSTLSATLVGSDPKKNAFDVISTITGNQKKDFEGGTISILGLIFHINKIDGKKIIVQEEPKIPFLLNDDDKAPQVFLEQPPQGKDMQGGTHFALMQTSDSPTKNLYAPAYVQPVYDLNYGTTDFNRNIESNENRPASSTDELTDHVNKGQNTRSSPYHWVVYIQGVFQNAAFQSIPTGTQKIEYGDADPIGELLPQFDQVRLAIRFPYFGETSARVDRGKLVAPRGSVIYRENIRDLAPSQTCSEDAIIVTATIHESGHQFGLVHPTSTPVGIMGVTPCPAEDDKKFTTQNLKIIRKSQLPQNPFSL